VILWGEGLCLNAGDIYRGFLTEIASHGFIVVASGAPAFQPEPVVHTTSDLLSIPGIQALVLTVARLRDQGWFTTPNSMLQVVDWVHRGGADKYGRVDKTKIMAAGQNCGAIEAYTATFNDDRIKFLSIFNSGLYVTKTRCMLTRLKAPVAYFLGGKSDFGAQLVCCSNCREPLTYAGCQRLRRLGSWSASGQAQPRHKQPWHILYAARWQVRRSVGSILQVGAEKRPGVQADCHEGSVHSAVRLKADTVWMEYYVEEFRDVFSTALVLAIVQHNTLNAFTPTRY
jgi:hypothetical protein